MLGYPVESSQKQRASCPLQDSNVQAKWTEASLILGLIGNQASLQKGLLKPCLDKDRTQGNCPFVTKLLSGEGWLFRRDVAHPKTKEPFMFASRVK